MYMSHYLDNKQSFLEPSVNQYGNHMVMTNVVRPLKTQFVNVDTRFRDEYNIISSHASCNITLPERINDVKSLMVRNAEIPMVINNISLHLGNHCFVVRATSSGNTATIVLENGEYTSASLKTAINTKLTNLGAVFDKLSIDVSANGTTSFKTTSAGYTVMFNVLPNGTTDITQIKNKLGWVLGFREAEYTIASTSAVYSENILQLNTVRYLYLVVDEFSRGNHNSFLCPIKNSAISKNVLARITLNKVVYPQNSILPANNFNGLLLSDNRKYHGSVDLQKLKIELVDENGLVVDLNGLDFSFCLEIEKQ